MLEHLLKLAAIGPLAIGMLAIYFTVRNNMLQLSAQIFLTYSERVRAIRGLTTAHIVNPEDAEAAVFLIFEFYELKRRRFVARSIWTIWDCDIVDFISSESFRAQWSEIRPRFRNHPHFLQWVDRHVGNATRKSIPRQTAASPNATRVA
jgi:hypothetical protein